MMWPIPLALLQGGWVEGVQVAMKWQEKAMYSLKIDKWYPSVPFSPLYITQSS